MPGLDFYHCHVCRIKVGDSYDGHSCSCTLTAHDFRDHGRPKGCLMGFADKDAVWEQENPFEKADFSRVPSATSLYEKDSDLRDLCARNGQRSSEPEPAVKELLETGRKQALAVYDVTAIPYRFSWDVHAGDVIRLSSGMAAVSITDVVKGGVACIAMEGLFDILKVKDEVIIAGHAVYWDIKAKRATYKEDGGCYLGIAFASATGAGSRVRVMLNMVLPQSGRTSCKEPHSSPGPKREESRVVHVTATGDALLDALNKHPDAMLHLTKRQIRQLSISVAKQALAEKQVCSAGVTIKSEAGELAVELTKGSWGQKFVTDVAKEAYVQLIRAVEERLSETVNGPYLDVLVEALKRKAEELGKKPQEKSEAVPPQAPTKEEDDRRRIREYAIYLAHCSHLKRFGEYEAVVKNWIEVLSTLPEGKLSTTTEAQLCALYESYEKERRRKHE